MADYALESAGAEILEHLTTSGLSTGNAMVKLWNIPIFYHTMSPRLAVQGMFLDNIVLFVFLHLHFLFPLFLISKTKQSQMSILETASLFLDNKEIWLSD